MHHARLDGPWARDPAEPRANPRLSLTSPTTHPNCPEQPPFDAVPRMTHVFFVPEVLAERPQPVRLEVTHAEHQQIVAATKRQFTHEECDIEPRQAEGGHRPSPARSPLHLAATLHVASTPLFEVPLMTHLFFVSEVLAERPQAVRMEVG